MGVWYEAYTFFGIEYNYEELKKIKENPEFQKCAQDIGCNELPNLLSEMYSNDFLTFMTDDYYKSEKDQTYYLGIQLTKQRLYSQPNYVVYNKKIEDECKKLKIMYKIPDIHNIVVKS